MRPPFHKRTARNTESGYALILIMFLLALLVLSTFAAAPTVLSNIQREKEADMVWRGKQYVRGVRLYYLKLHRFPTSMDDLTKPKTGIRFMRQAYKDPMNQVDGSWRLIYVGPNGQLIGSLNTRNLMPSGQMGPQSGLGTSGALSSLFSNAGNAGGMSSSFNSTVQAASTTFSNNPTGGNPQSSAVGTALQNATSTTDPNAQNPDDPSQPHSIAGPMDASNTIGGNIIGVGSKVNRKSFMVYEKAKNYRLFEFIWDPSKDTTGRASGGIGTPVQNMNGTNPAGTNASPFGPVTTPGQNPSQNQNSPSTQDPTPPLQAPPAN